MPANFFDTNVLLYLVSSDKLKADRAEAMLAEGGAISVQVLNEIANVARRKMGMSWTDTHAFLQMLRSLVTVHPLSAETHETGLELAERYGLSLYDSMIAAAALLAGCNRLWSEDMQHGMLLEGATRIMNPFRDDGGHLDDGESQAVARADHLHAQSRRGAAVVGAVRFSAAAR